MRVVTDFTKRLERARSVQHHHTHAQAAAALGITKSLYGKWERGETRPQPHHLSALSAYFGEAEEEVHELVVDATRQSPKGARPSPANMTARIDALEREVATIKGQLTEQRELVRSLILELRLSPGNHN